MDNMEQNETSMGALKVSSLQIRYRLEMVFFLQKKRKIQSSFYFEGKKTRKTADNSHFKTKLGLPGQYQI